jgi:hypothetical protein
MSYDKEEQHLSKLQEKRERVTNPKPKQLKKPDALPLAGRQPSWTGGESQDTPKSTCKAKVKSEDTTRD